MINIFLRACLIALFLTTNVMAQQAIQVKLDPSLKGPYSGRLIVYLQSDTTKAFGRAREDWPAYSITVREWRAGTTQTIDASSAGYPKSIDSVPAGYYRIVAMLDTNSRERSLTAPGNLYSRTEVVAKLDGGRTAAPVLTLSHVASERKFSVTARTREVRLHSQLLSSFRKEAIYLQAGVVLPESYDRDSTRYFPVVYVIPGWGGTHHHANSQPQWQVYGVDRGLEKIYVFLNPESHTPYGLHAFIDSRINGPWGSALVEELVPHLEQQFRIKAKPDQRLLTGQSSGGYGAIWLAMHFPEDFGGCWATSPDPVDFSNFIGVDLYGDPNFYLDSKQRERGINIIDGKAQTTLSAMARKELVEGDGGQLQSFGAAFGIPDRDGRPVPLFDPLSGAINKAVVSTWEGYDLGRYLQRHWKGKRRLLAGKVYIYAGENDNFHLQRSLQAFAQKAKKVGAAIHAEIVPGADHYSTRSMVGNTIQATMDAALTSEQ
jgi:S-formylglutathione hydrolase FrmB